MTFSFAALLSTLLLSSTIVFLQILLLKGMRINHILSASFLMIVSIIFIIRLCFPVEFFFTKTLPSKVILPLFDSILEYPLQITSGVSLSIGSLTIIIWSIGAFVSLIRFCHTQFKIHDLKRIFSLNPSFTYKKRKVVLVEEKISPVVIGFIHPIILLPNLDISEKQREFILDHELFHISNYDIWIKHIYELLSIIYWWNPVIYIFKNSFNQVIELKADESVVSNLSTEEKMEYVETLLSVGSKINRNCHQNELKHCPSFTSSNQGNLLIRAKYIFLDHKKRPVKPLLILFTLVCFYFSGCIVFESYSVEPKVADSTISITDEDSFLVKTDSNNYKVYSNDGFLFEVSNEDRETQFPKLKVFSSFEEGESYVKENN